MPSTFRYRIAVAVVLTLLLGLVPLPPRAAQASEDSSGMISECEGPAPSDVEGTVPEAQGEAVPQASTLYAAVVAKTMDSEWTRGQDATLSKGKSAADASGNGSAWSRRTRAQKVWIVIGIIVGVGAIAAAVSGGGGGNGGSGGGGGGGY